MTDIVVQLPDGSEAHFPEGTDPGVMQAALQKQYATPAQTNAQAPSLMQRAGDAISQGYKDVNDFGNNLGDSFAHHVASVPVGLAQLGMHGA
jgi:hypothetical protein